MFGGVITYANWYRKALRSAQYDRAWADMARSHFRDHLLPRLEESLVEEERVYRAFQENIDGGSDFVLYLRNFASEASTRVVNDPQGDKGVMTHLRPQGVSFENALAEALEGRVRTVGITNPSAILLVPSRIPKLYLSDDAWPGSVAKLMNAAALIILYVERYSPGVIEELKLIQTQGAECKTVLVLGSVNDKLDQVEALMYRARTGQDPPPLPDAVRRGDILIADFPYVVAVDTIDFNCVFEREPFGSFLQSIEFRSKLGPDQRALVHEINRLAALGHAALSAEQYDDAVTAFEKSAALCERIADQNSWLRARVNAGKCRQLAKAYSPAAETFKELLPVARRHNDSFVLSLVEYHLARCLYEVGDTTGALSVLNDLLPLFEVAGRLQERRGTLHMLGWIHQDREELVEALEYYCAALQLYADDSTGCSLCSLACSIGETCVALGDYPAALSAYQSAVAYGVSTGCEGLRAYAAEEFAKLEQMGSSQQSEYPGA